MLTHFAERGDIEFVRPDRLQCTGGRCNYLVNGRSLFSDDNHVARAEVVLFEPLFAAALDAAMTGTRSSAPRPLN